MAEGMTYSVMGTKRFQEWRRMFKATQIEYALKPASQAKVSGFRFDGSSFSCYVNMGSYHYSVSMGELPGADEDWDDVPIYCNCRRAVESRRGTNRRDPWFFDFYEPEVWQWHRCNHMAIALAHWERRLGELYGEGEGELSKEQRERNQAYVELSKEELPADYPFRDRERPQNIISRFDVGAMLKARNMTTNRFFVNEFEKLRAAGSPPVVQVVRDKVGGDYLRCQKSYPTNGRFVHTSGEVRKDSLYFTCGCADPRGQGVLCAHMLDVLGALMYEADRLPLADQTDTQALSIIQGVLQAHVTAGKALDKHFRLALRSPQELKFSGTPMKMASSQDTLQQKQSQQP